MPALADGKWYGYVDDNGTIVVSDTRTDLRSRAFDPKTFDTFALRQIGAPHSGRSVRAHALSAAERKFTPLLQAAAIRNGLDLALVKAVVAVESGFRAEATSRVGALGLMQLMPATARELGVNPRDPAENVDGGTRYLAGLLKMFGSERLALAAYNAGPGRVRRAGGIPKIPETQRYVREVLLLRAQYARANSRPAVGEDVSGVFGGR